MTEVRDAATVIVLRGSPLEVLLLRRHARSGFMAGAYVFPGGKVDPADRAQVHHRPELLERARILQPTPGRALSLEDAAAHYLTAVRETSEESGLELDPLQLHYFAHWITPELAPRRYDTRFFVGRAPEGHLLTHDGDETIAALWARPADALDRFSAGGFDLIRPTEHSLEILSAYPDADAVLAAAAAGPVGMETPS